MPGTAYAFLGVRSLTTKVVPTSGAAACRVCEDGSRHDEPAQQGCRRAARARREYASYIGRRRDTDRSGNPRLRCQGEHESTLKDTKEYREADEALGRYYDLDGGKHVMEAETEPKDIREDDY